MPKFTIYPFLGTPQTVDGVSLEVAPNGNLLVLTGDVGPNGMAGMYKWEKDTWAFYRPGEPPHTDADRIVSNAAANNPHE